MATTTMVSYPASCHCGRVQFTASLPDITTEEIIRCNCSICTKNGYLLVYPKVEHVAFSAGEGRLGEYLFGNKKKPHKFCIVCGTSILIDFSKSDMASERAVTAVNVGYSTCGSIVCSWLMVAADSNFPGYRGSATKVEIQGRGRQESALTLTLGRRNISLNCNLGQQ